MPHPRERIALTLRRHFPQSLHGLRPPGGCLPPSSRGNVFPQGFPLRERVLATGQQRERIPAGFPSSPAGACISIIKDSKSKASVTQTNKRKQMQARQNLPAPYVPFEKGKQKKCTPRGPSLLHTFPRCRRKANARSGVQGCPLSVLGKMGTSPRDKKKPAATYFPP